MPVTTRSNSRAGPYLTVSPFVPTHLLTMPEGDATTPTHTPPRSLSPTPGPSSNVTAATRLVPIESDAFAPIQLFDGTNPADITNVLLKTEDLVSAKNPHLSPTSDAFGRLCITAVSRRLDLTSPAVSGAYHTWLDGRAPTWANLKKQFFHSFRPQSDSPFLAFVDILTNVPSNQDRTSLLSHFNDLNKLFNDFYILTDNDNNLKTLFTQDNKLLFRDFFFVCSSLLAFPKPVRQSACRRLDTNMDPQEGLDRVLSAVGESRPSPLFAHPHTVAAVAPSAPSHPPPSAQRSNKRPPRPSPPPCDSRHARAPATPQDWLPPPRTCFNCMRAGHTVRNCRFRAFCPFHNRPGHSFKECIEFSDLADSVTARLRNRSRDFQRGRQTNNAPQ